MQMDPSIPQGMATTSPTAGAVSAAWGEYIAPDGRPYYYNSITGKSTWERPPEMDAMVPPLPPPPPPALGSTSPYGPGASYHFGSMPYASYPGYSQAYAAAYRPQLIGPGPPIQTTKDAQGPKGANLFIFHIPNDFTNADMYNLFSAYGNVISARIMVEKVTGRSRGFGFVSFDNADSAQAAIKALDGFQIGRKRLKVSLKQAKEKDRKPHTPSPHGHPGQMPAFGFGHDEGLPASMAGGHMMADMRFPHGATSAADAKQQAMETLVASFAAVSVGGPTQPIPATMAPSTDAAGNGTTPSHTSPIDSTAPAGKSEQSTPEATSKAE